MTDLDSGVRVLSFDDPLLSSSAVAKLEQTLQREPEVRPTVLLCNRLVAVTPQGLTALLELGSQAAGSLALAGLSRRVTLAAIQAGLAQHFPIYASAEAFARARDQLETEPCEP